MNFQVNDNRSYVSRMMNLTEAKNPGAGADSFFAKAENATIDPLNSVQPGVVAPVEVDPLVDDPLIAPKGTGKSSGAMPGGIPTKASTSKSKDDEDDDGDDKPKAKKSENENPFKKSNDKKQTDDDKDDKEPTMKKENTDIKLSFNALYERYLAEAEGDDDLGLEDLPEDEEDFPPAEDDDFEDTDTDTDTNSAGSRLRSLIDELTAIADELDGDEDFGDEGEDFGDDDEDFGDDDFGDEDENTFGESVKNDGKLSPMKKSTLGPGSSQVVKGKLAKKRGGKANTSVKKRDATGNPKKAKKSKYGPKMSPVVKSTITGKNQEFID